MDLSQTSLSDEHITLMQQNPLAEEFWYQAGTDDLDELLERFLVARQWQVNAAHDMIIKCLQWRHQFGVRKLMESGESALAKTLLEPVESFFFKTDKEGRPVMVLRPRLHDPSKHTTEQIASFAVFQIEVGRRLLGDAKQVCLLFDLKDASYSNFDFNGMKFVIQALQDYYPECLGRCLIVSAPWFFSGFFKMIKPLLDPVVTSKIVFVSNLMALQDYIPAENLLADYGGECRWSYEYISRNESKYRLAPDQISHLQRTVELEKTRFIDLTLSSTDELLSNKRAHCKEVFHKAQHELELDNLAPTFYHRLGVICAKSGKINWNNIAK